MQKRLAACAVCAIGLWVGTKASALPGELPPDVRAGHWAARGVSEALENGVLALQSDHEFHGEAKVTRDQAAGALVKLARLLEADRWHALPSSPVPDSVSATLEHGDWKQRPVTRYVLASVLARFGDYVTHGITRAPAGSKDANQSEVWADMGQPKLTKAQATNAALAYLAEHHEMLPKSPLLKPGDQPITGGELSQAVSEMVIGLNNRLTPMGHDANGGTPDATFHKPKSAPKPN